MRDLKPGNVLLDTNSRAKLADFGFAGLDTSGAGSWSWHDLDSAAMQEPEKFTRVPPSTRGYVAPEILLQEPTGFRSDFYSLGVLILVGLTGGSDMRGGPPNYGIQASPAECEKDWMEIQALAVSELRPADENFVRLLTQRHPNQRPSHTGIRDSAFMQSLTLPGWRDGKRKAEDWLETVCPKVEMPDPNGFRKPCRMTSETTFPIRDRILSVDLGRAVSAPAPMASSSWQQPIPHPGVHASSMSPPFFPLQSAPFMPSQATHPMPPPGFPVMTYPQIESPVQQMHRQLSVVMEQVQNMLQQIDYHQYEHAPDGVIDPQVLLAVGELENYRQNIVLWQEYMVTLPPAEMTDMQVIWSIQQEVSTKQQMVATMFYDVQKLLAPASHEVGLSDFQQEVSSQLSEKGRSGTGRKGKGRGKGKSKTEGKSEVKSKQARKSR